MYKKIQKYLLQTLKRNVYKRKLNNLKVQIKKKKLFYLLLNMWYGNVKMLMLQRHLAVSSRNVTKTILHCE